MQRFILGKKNHIALIGAILIVFGFIAGLGLKNELLSNWVFGIASVLGATPIAIQAFSSLRVKVIGIDVLVILAVIGAFIIKNFEESAIVTFLFLFGAILEQRTLNKTRSAIKELTEMAPETALKQMENGEFQQVEVDEVDVGDILLVKTGAKVPVDGTVLSGEGHINEASITGESLQVGKKANSGVFAGTILENGTLQIVADRVGEDTTFGKIIELVEEAQDSKSAAERFIDKFAKYYTPAILLFAIGVWVVTFIIAGELLRENIELAVTILVLGCPGALVIGVPISNVAGIGNGARHGILLKGSEIFQDFSKADTFIFDKTGTLTEGKPQVAEQELYSKNSDQILSYLASVERESDHPLAKAVLLHIGETQFYPVENTDVVKGGGIVATVDGRRVAVGNVALMKKEEIHLSEKALADIARYEQNGNSIVLTAIDGELGVIMGIRDQIRRGVKDTLQRLRKLGVKNLVLLSGDNQGTVDLVAKELGLTEAHGNMLPEDKSHYIKGQKSKKRRIVFVGDGVNDSPSLAMADVGIAMGGGTDVAIETSDVVLMNSDFSRLPHALGLTKTTARNMIQNILIALGVVAFLLISVFFSDWMNMSIGMLVHEASVLLVILNGMRILAYKLPNKKIKKVAKASSDSNK